jgi:tartrate-resistant acid phosphatase type 5
MAIQRPPEPTIHRPPPSRRATLFSLLKLLLLAPFAGAKPVRASTGPVTQKTGSIDLFAMGDWGEDTDAQRKVASQMSRTAQDLGPTLAAVLLCGDSFYFPLTGVDDPRWQSLFEKMYDPAPLGVPFFSCLGNHDCDSNNLAIQLDYAHRHPESRFKLPALWYRREIPEQNPLVSLIMLDSNKDNLTELQWNRQIAWLKDQLTSPRAPWTICCAHHPMFSNGFFFSNPILQRDWGELFEQHHVDFYLAGHEHNLQHLEIPGWHESFLIAGGGGAHAHPLFRADRGFSREVFGFVHFAITPSRAVVQYIDADGAVIHKFDRSKSGDVNQILTTPNSTPQKNALKALLELRNRPPATQP